MENNSSVNIIKLINGDTLLAEVTHEDKDFIHIIDPVQVNITTRQDSVPVCISTIWVPLTKAVNLFHIKQNNVLVSSVVDEDYELYYNRCIEALRESMEETSDTSLLGDGMEEDDIQKVLGKLQLQSNTAVH